MVEKIDKIIGSIIDETYNINFEPVNKNIEELIGVLISYSSMLESNDQNKFNAIITKLFAALQDKDLLLFTDILQYDLLLFLNTINKANVEM